jgi:hypothetical protein
MAAQSMEQAGPEGQQEHAPRFNHGLLCCLPKSPSHTRADGTPLYDASDTRPLSIVDCTNRVIANAFRLRREPHYAPYITQAQQGFLPGRSLLRNVADLEHDSMIASLTCDRPATLLLDFAAALPNK